LVSLRFYGGVGEIGGNKILLEDGDVSVWLDFGESFNMGCDYYVGWLKPRSQNLLGDLFEFNLIPRLKGLYAEHLLRGTDLGYVEPRFDGVFISHAHFDHVNHIEFLDPSIPVYTGAGTKLFIEAMEKTSTYVNYGKHDFRSFRTDDHILIDQLELDPIHVDHSIPGAYGFIVHTLEGAIIYTGDMRAHGPRQDMTEEFLDAAAETKPIAMISEGTRMTMRESRKNLSEAQVLAGVKEVCSQAEGRAVLYAHGPRDMDRLRTFYQAALDNGRQMVITPKTAYLLQRLLEDEHLDLPDPVKDDRVEVYYRRKKSGEYDDMDYYIWERSFLDKIITAEQLRMRPQEYLINLDFYSFTELIDIRPEAGSHFIYSMSEPFTEEDLEARVMHNWLEHFGLRYHQLHASGHMSRKELTEAIKKINPRWLFPVHTENPDLFKRFFDNAIPPEKGRSYDIQ
jgi:ribonuclease J